MRLPVDVRYKGAIDTRYEAARMNQGAVAIGHRALADPQSDTYD